MRRAADPLAQILNWKIPKFRRDLKSRNCFAAIAAGMSSCKAEFSIVRTFADRQINQPLRQVGDGIVVEPSVSTITAHRRRGDHHAALSAHIDARTDAG